MTLNTHKGFSASNARFILHDLRDAIRKVGADVVFLQEVLGAHSGHASTVPDWPKDPQYEFLADSIWKDYAYGRNAVYPEGHHGNAILSKYPIHLHGNRNISAHSLEQRGLLHCEIMLDAKRKVTVDLLCVHLGLLSLHRKRQVKMIHEYVLKKIPDERALIIAGDFNDWSSSAHVLMQETLNVKEAHGVVHGHLARTFPSQFPVLPLDRIYMRGFKAKKAWRLHGLPWKKLSDHNGLVSELEIMDRR